MLGVQTPTFQRVPKQADNSAPSVIELSTGYGLTLFQWQQHSLTAMLGELPNGDWAATVYGSCVSRQNGKGEIILARELAGLLLFDEKIFHTAHLGKTADDAFNRLWSIFQSHEDLRQMVRRHSEAASRSFIELRSGARIDFATRSKDAGRGLSIDLLVVDEAQEVTDNELRALQFTQAARPNSQMLLFGTVPGEDANGTVFENYRKAAQKGTSSRMAWLEWSADPNDDLDDQDVWAKTNPSLGLLITVQTIIDERAGQSDEGFARERLSMWSDGSTTRVIPADLWTAQGSPSSKPVSDYALSIDVTNDRSRAVVALSGKRADGTYHVEKYEARAGIGWVVDYITNVLDKNEIRAVVVDGRSQAMTLVDPFKKEGVKLTVTGEREMATACGLFYDGTVEGWLYHTAQPEVAYAISQVRKRPLLGGEAFGWNRKNTASDITPVVAMTLALWGSMNSKVKKPGGKKTSSQRLITLS